MAIPIARTVFGEEEVQAVRAVLESGWVTQGPTVEAFEKAFAEYVGVQHACAVSNGTAALHLALLAAGVRPGDVVITVSHSFVATANAVRHCSAGPAFVDIDLDTFNISPATLECCLNEDFEERDGSLWYHNVEALRVGESPLVHTAGPRGRLAAILIVHQVGMPADLGRIMPLARRAGVPVIEDAACAIGSEITFDGGASWARIGRPHGDIACFSFHPRKVISTGEGGMLTTANEAFDQKFRLLRSHGMSLPAIARHQAAGVAFETYETTAFNYRLTDIQAAIGLEQLKRLPEIVRRRRELACGYVAALADIPGLIVPVEPAYARSNWQSYVVRLADAKRQRVMMQALKERGVSTRRGVTCAHREPAYAPAWPTGGLPHSEKACDSGIMLPLYPQMEDSLVDRIAADLRNALTAGAANSEAA